MATASNLGVDRGEVLPTGHRTAGLPHRLGQRHKIVHAVWRRIELALVPDEIPAAWSGKTSGVLFAKVVRVRLGERGERTDNSGRVGVDVGQRRDSKPRAAVAGATPWETSPPHVIAMSHGPAASTRRDSARAGRAATATPPASCANGHATAVA